MKIKQLLQEMERFCPARYVQQGDQEQEVTELVYDSRKVVPGAMFVCISGVNCDGHAFAQEAAQKGANVLITEKKIVPVDGVTVVQVENTREALAYLSAAFFGYPAKQLKIIGITGTKGKTTTTYMVRQMLEQAGIQTGLIGTIETIIGKEHIQANNTTPESYLIQQSFRKMVDAGCTCVVMEVSSQGLMLHRVTGILFDYGVFTNLEPDHIGPAEHKDFAEYLACKAKLFQQCRYGIFNLDDAHVKQIQQNSTCEVETFGLSNKADFYAEGVELLKEAGKLGVQYDLRGKLDCKVKLFLPGYFSVYNSLVAIAICNHFGVKKEEMQRAIAHVMVKGRVEPVPVSEKFTVLIDYAHNAMSLESVLQTIRAYCPKRIVCLFGCGGNRAKQRRFEMGEISSRLADVTVVTSDNPRREEPEKIIEDILVGVKKGNGKYIAIQDRKEAIRYCLLHAKEGDVILLAGKGHETYQEICGIKYPMDERVLIEEVCQEEGISVKKS